MSKNIKEYKKKAKRIEKTLITVSILIFVLGVLISIVQYGIKKNMSNQEKQNASSGEYSIDLNDNIIIYEKDLKFTLNIGNYDEENNYEVIIKINDKDAVKENEIYKENKFDLNFSDEGKNVVSVVIYKNGEQSGNFEKNIFYVEPYKKQYLDELSNKGVLCHYKDGTWEKYSKSAELNDNLGTNYLRMEFVWNVIDKNNGTYDFSGYDPYLNKTQKNVIGIFNEQKSGFLAGSDLKINTQEELEKFVTFVGKVAERYPFIKYYQILNEPNYSNSNNAYIGDEDIKWYTKVIEETYKKLKSINSDINIIVGATAVSLSDGNTYISSENFFRKINNMTYNFSSGYAYHPYDIYNNKLQNQLYLKKIEIHNNLFNEFGGFIKKYITEYGIPSFEQYGVNEELQAVKLTQQTVILDDQNVDLAIIYNLWNIGNNTSNQQYNYGLLYNNYTPKPSYYAMKNYYQNTNGAEYIGSLNITNGLEAHAYDKDGHPLIIAWSNNTDNTYNFTLNQMTAKDIYGKEITPDSNGQIQITTSPVYLYNVPTNYFYQAISNTATTKYNEFTENYADQISKVQGLQQTINTLNQRMKDLSSTSNLDETTSINLMKQHFNLGNTLIQAYKSGTLQIEYVKLSSMLDALNDIGNSFEDLVTVSAKTRNANISETLDTINKADNLINDNDIEMIYPSKILQFSQDFYDKASYINGLEEENDIKTGLIVSKNLHSKLLSDWATQFANFYIDTYIKNNPVTIDYSETNTTNQNVTATLRTNAQITINNNSNSKAYTFTQNGTFTFDYTIKGQTFQQTATVNNIDKTAPTIGGVENDRLYLSEVTPKATDTNLKEVLLYKDNNQVQNYQQNTQITEDGHYKLIAKDSAGNQTSVEFDISRNPAIIDYSEVNLTNQDVVATVNSNFDVNVKNNSNQKSYTFKVNGEFTFELNIKGAELQLTAKVDNIDKTPPTITDVEDKKQYIDKVTPKISDDNLNEVKLYFDSEEVQGYAPNSEITGEGFYKLVAKDLAGNETSVEFTIIENPDEKYQIKDGNILNIKNNTNQDTFRKKLKMSGEYSIYRNDTLISDNDKIATGDKLRKSTGEEYTLIVSGDINNDGDVNIKDIVMLRKYLLERNNLDENSLLAADCNLDGKDISIKDLIRMRLIALERDVN